MATSKKKATSPKSGDVDKHSPAVEPSTSGADPATSSCNKADAFSKRTWLLGAILMAIAWGVILTALARLYANPVTFNRRQLEQSDLIVGGSVKDIDSGQFAVEKSWISPDSAASVTIEDLESLPNKTLTNGMRLIVPVRRTANGNFVVTSVKRRDGVVSQYIYPFTKAAESRLEEMLNAINAEAD